MRPEDLLLPTPSGVCCKTGGFYIDPTRPVDRALITHGHSDHARAGHGAVLATQETLDIMRLRYGEDFAGSTQAIRYGETVSLNGVSATFHPAGHVLGSAQIAVERKGCRIVASGAIDELKAASGRQHLEIEVAGAHGDWLDGHDKHQVLDRTGDKVKLLVDRGVDLTDLLARARAAGEVRTFSYEPPKLSELFMEAVAPDPAADTREVA